MTGNHFFELAVLDLTLDLVSEFLAQMTEVDLLGQSGLFGYTPRVTHLTDAITPYAHNPFVQESDWWIEGLGRWLVVDTAIEAEVRSRLEEMSMSYATTYQHTGTSSLEWEIQDSADDPWTPVLTVQEILEASAVQLEEPAHVPSAAMPLLLIWSIVRSECRDERSAFQLRQLPAGSLILTGTVQCLPEHEEALGRRLREIARYNPDLNYALSRGKLSASVTKDGEAHHLRLDLRS